MESKCRWWRRTRVPRVQRLEAFMGQMNIVPVLGESFNQVGFWEIGRWAKKSAPCQKPTVKSLLSLASARKFVHLQRFRPTLRRGWHSHTVGLGGKARGILLRSSLALLHFCAAATFSTPLNCNQFGFESCEGGGKTRLVLPVNIL